MTATFKRIKLEHFLIPYTKVNSKWIKDLNLRPETIKHLEENISSTLFDINHSNILFVLLPRVVLVQSLSSVQLCDPMDCGMPPILHHLLELDQTPVH